MCDFVGGTMSLAHSLLHWSVLYYQVTLSDILGLAWKSLMSSAYFSVYVQWKPLCKQNGPRSDCSFRSRLIRIHSVCFPGTSILECI